MFRLVIAAACVTALAACATTQSSEPELFVTGAAARSTQAALAEAGPDAAASDSADVAAAAKQRPSGKDVICRYQSAATGSRLGKRRVCATREEWDRLAGESRKVAEEIQSSGQINYDSGR